MERNHFRNSSLCVVSNTAFHLVGQKNHQWTTIVNICSEYKHMNIKLTFCSRLGGAQSAILYPCSKSLLDPGASCVSSTIHWPEVQNRIRHFYLKQNLDKCQSVMLSPKLGFQNHPCYLTSIWFWGESNNSSYKTETIAKPISMNDSQIKFGISDSSTTVTSKRA